MSASIAFPILVLEVVQVDALSQKIFRIRKPSPKLFWYYLIVSFAGLVFQPLVFLPLFFKYHTLEYHFDGPPGPRRPTLAPRATPLR